MTMTAQLDTIKKGWDNRIVDHGVRPASEYVANPKNWRTHPMKQRAAVEGSLNEIGWIDTVIVNRRTGYLVDGHERLWQALKAGEDTPVPFIEVDLSEEEEALALASLDPIAGMAGADRAKLDELMQEINTGEAGLHEMLAELAEENDIAFGDQDEPPEDAEPQIDKAEELRQKWGVESGQLWQLGEHRIICGDCTDKSVVDRVMDGEKATLAPVDPPYNVGFDYDGSTVDDDKVSEKYEQFSREWFVLCQSVSERQLVTPGCNNLALWMRWFDAYHWGAWTKTNSMTNGRVSRFWCWEPVLFFGEHWGKSRHSDIFDYPIGQQKDTANHPCPKPLTMWQDIIENYSNENDIIYEAFNGSGTTLIACERLHRKCRAIEISPAYVAVAIQRWVDVTGGTPELVGG
jgi:hypothetical protein